MKEKLYKAWQWQFQGGSARAIISGLFIGGVGGYIIFELFLK